MGARSPLSMRTLGSTVLALLLALSLFGGVPSAGTGSGGAYAQADSTALLRIEQAFRAADARMLLEGSANRVDLVIFGKGASYSRAQAELVLGDFFRRYPPKQVVFEQEVLAEDRRSMIGRYWVIDGGAKPIGVSVRLRARGSGWQLRAIRIDRGSR